MPAKLWESMVRQGESMVKHGESMVKHGEFMVKQGKSHVEWFSGDWQLHKRFMELILLYHVSCLKAIVFMLVGLSPLRKIHYTKESGCDRSMLLLISQDLGFGTRYCESGFKVLDDYTRMLVWTWDRWSPIFGFIHGVSCRKMYQT